MGMGEMCFTVIVLFFLFFATLSLTVNFLFVFAATLASYVHRNTLSKHPVQVIANSVKEVSILDLLGLILLNLTWVSSDISATTCRDHIGKGSGFYQIQPCTSPPIPIEVCKLPGMLFSTRLFRVSVKYKRI